MSIPHLCRRAANRWLGHGPWRVEPAAEIVSRRTDELRNGVELSETFAGVLGTEVYPPQHYHPPLVLLGADRVHRPSTAGGGPRYSEFCGIAPHHRINVWTLQDAVVCGPDGMVYCPRSRTAVAETARQWRAPARAHPILAAPRRPAPRPLSGIALHLITLDDGSFYHFLHESLSRLWLARHWRAQVAWFIVGGPREATRESWLRAAGVSSERIHWLGRLESVRCEQLIFTDLPLRTCQPMAAHAAALRDIFNVSVATPASPRRRLWVSRAGASQRHLEWEDELLTMMPGFEKITPSSMSPEEQIAHFSSAEAVVGPHGAGLANLTFARPGGALIEIFRPGDPWHPLYSRLADGVGWRHAWACVDFDRATQKEGLAEKIRCFLERGA